ncbi:conserved hypothetical protein [Phenylobacterium zucineum HLK1]|uniref:SCP domain-containing protein n=1 Tax=Phenylobacterium zucineum (strain HLK1) TaxID=450851 RepID=B4R9G2_PHEZH|nr:CAP domain-containing protein [Phenylobacterium zucineum]ACG79422.1 conserved hypothetical protein [Phenylobacterium zucineum HLK1]
MSRPAAPTRRLVLAGGLAAAGVAQGARAAPGIADASPWIAYESRLRARLADAGGGRFDGPAEREILDLTNAARAASGAPPLRWDEELAETARAHAADLAHRNYFEHLSPEAFDPSHRFWLLARRTIGSPSENLALHRGSGRADPAGLMRNWRGSPPHWRNLLKPGHTHAGFGLVRIGDSDYLAGLYARPVLTLPQPFPFRPSAREFAAALQAVPEAVEASTPQGGAWSRADGAPRVMQLSARRPLEGRAYERIGGPIFVTPA